MLYQRIRRTKMEISPRKKSKMKRNNTIGVLVAYNDFKTSEVKVGWSLVNKKAGDEFSKSTGILNAVDRALKPSKVYAQCLDGTIPKSIQSDVNRFLERCERYFKDTLLT